MKKSTKIWLIVAASLLIAGCMLFVGVMNMIKWNFSKLATVQFETNTYDIENDFSNICISTDTADVSIIKSDNGKCYVECDESAKLKYTISTNGTSLEIKLVDTRGWYNYIGIFNGTPKLTLYLPEGEYQALNIKNNTGLTSVSDSFKFENIDVTSTTGYIKCYASASGNIKLHASTGHIYASDVTANNIDIKVSTGHVSLSSVYAVGDIRLTVSTGKSNFENVTCNNFSSEGGTGDFKAINLTVNGKLDMERSTGDIKIDYLSAGEVDIDTDTGDVNITLVKEMTVYAETDTGKLDYPRFMQGGKCEIETDTGNIKVTFVG